MNRRMTFKVTLDVWGLYINWNFIVEVRFSMLYRWA